jgi:hypothetical protein
MRLRQCSQPSTCLRRLRSCSLHFCGSTRASEGSEPRRRGKRTLLPATGRPPPLIRAPVDTQGSGRNAQATVDAIFRQFALMDAALRRTAMRCDGAARRYRRRGHGETPPSAVPVDVGRRRCRPARQRLERSQCSSMSRLRTRRRLATDPRRLGWFEPRGSFASRAVAGRTRRAVFLTAPATAVPALSASSLVVAAALAPASATADPARRI